MRIHLLCYTLILAGLSHVLNAQTNTLFSQCYGGNNNEAVYKILPTSDSGFIFTGHTWSNNQQVNGQHGARDIWVVKCDTAGQMEWQRCLGGTSEEGATCMFQQGNSFVVGGFASSVDGNVTGNHGDSDFWLIKLRDDNTMQWKKCFGGTNGELMNDVIPTADGGYLMAGFTFSNDGDVSGLHGPPGNWADVWVVKIDAQRNIQWQKCLGGTEADAAYRVIELNGGNIIIAASANSTNGDITLSRGNRDIWMIKLDAQGNLLQQKNFGGSYDEAPSDMILTSNQHLLITGYSFSADGDLTGNYFNGTTNWEDVWVFQIDTSFNLQWQKNLGGTHSDVGNRLLETPKGYLLGAESSSVDFDRTQSFGFKDYWLVLLDTVGTILWQQSFGGNAFDFLKTMTIDYTGQLLLGGFTSSSNLCTLGNADIWLLKLDTAVTTSSLVTTANPLNNFKVGPVPFTDELTIDLSDRMDVRKIMVHDVMGKLYFSAVAFPSIFSINTRLWPTGIYMIIVQDIHGLHSKKIIRY
jgi:hypothetical protein